MNVFNAYYVGVVRALGAFNASGRVSNAGVGNAGESIRAFSWQFLSTAHISLTAVKKTPCTFRSAFNGLGNAEFSTFSIDAHFYRQASAFV